MENTNRITINGVIHTILQEQGMFLLFLPGAHYLLRVKADEALLKQAKAYQGKRMNITGKLASEDAALINQCKCNTISNTIESFVIADDITATHFNNHVKIKGMIVDTPKLITTDKNSFYTCRIHLSDNNGYISVSTPDNPGKKGDVITVEGHLRWKDYNRILTCKKCGKSYTVPTLSLLVICR